MYKQPLFGEDSSPHITSMLVSAIVTLVCWIIFCVLCFVIKFKPKTPEYKEVQIVLSSTPVVEKEKTEAAESVPAAAMQEEAPPAAAEVPELPKPVETPVAEAKIEVPKKQAAPAQTSKTTAPSTSSGTPKTTKASSPSTKATDPAKKVNFDDFQYATDYSDFDFNNVSTSSSKNNFDWSQFEDSAEPEPQISQKIDKVTTASSTFGSAGSTSVSDQRKTSTDSNPQKDNKNIQESEATKTALARIAKATPYSKSTGNIDSTVTAQTAKSNDGSVNLKMSDGSIRKLRNPTEPKIELPPAVAEYVTEDLSVIIKIKVLDKGNVLLTNIDITPPILPEPVKNEVMRQLNRWLFDEDPNVPLASAEFEYTIKKN